MKYEEYKEMTLPFISTERPSGEKNGRQKSDAFPSRQNKTDGHGQIER